MWRGSGPRGFCGNLAVAWARDEPGSCCSGAWGALGKAREQEQAELVCGDFGFLWVYVYMCSFELLFFFLNVSRAQPAQGGCGASPASPGPLAATFASAKGFGSPGHCNHNCRGEEIQTWGQTLHESCSAQSRCRLQLCPLWLPWVPRHPSAFTKGPWLSSRVAPMGGRSPTEPGPHSCLRCPGPLANCGFGRGQGSYE